MDTPIQDATMVSYLYEQYAGELFRYIRQRVGDTEESEDLCADVFVKVLEGIGRYEDRGWPISAWLYRIAHDRVVDHIRRRSRRRHVSWEEWGGVSTDDVWDSLMRNELHAVMLHALDRLNGDQRNVIVMQYFYGRSVSEIALILGRSVKSVKGLRHRGLQTLAVAFRAA